MRVLERAAAQAPRGDLTDVVVDARADPDDDAAFILGIPGTGETAVGAHYDPDRHQVVIDTEELV
jgi:hypothetical protein